METYFAEIGEIYLICIDNIIELIQPVRYLSSTNIRGIEIASGDPRAIVLPLS